MIKLLLFIGNQKNLLISIGISILALLIHHPFLDADPDCTYNFSRDALTDEGLYAQQMRNYVHTGETFFYKSDVMAKTPFYQCMIYPIAKFSDGARMDFRICFLVFFSILIGLIAFSFQWHFFTLLFLILHALNSYSFSYFHYALPEGIAVSMIIFSLFLFLKSIKTRDSVYLLFAGLILFFVYTTKFIFINALGLIPFIFTAHFLINPEWKKWLKYLSILLISLIVICFIAYQFIFLKHREFISFLFSNQKSNSRFHLSYDFIHTNLTNHFQDEKIALFKPLLICSMLCFFALIIVKFFINKALDKIDQFYLAAFSFCLLWLMSESFKFGMEYMPNRYFFPYHVAIVLLISICMSYVYQFHSMGKLFICLIVLALIIFKSPLYFESIQNRKFIQRDISIRLNKILEKGDYAAGVWSCGLTWGNKINSIPIWANFSDSAFLFSKKPKIIFTESNQAESDSVFGHWRIDLKNIATKKYSHKIDKWIVDEWWVK